MHEVFINQLVMQAIVNKFLMLTVYSVLQPITSVSLHYFMIDRDVCVCFR